MLNEDNALSPPGPECFLAEWIYQDIPLFKQIRSDAVALGLNPDAVLLTGIARLAVLMGPVDVPGPRLTTLGIMVPLIGNSGDGKGTIQDLVDRHLPARMAAFPERIRRIGLGTGQGLAKAFYSEIVDQTGAHGHERTVDGLWIVGSESGGISDIAKINNGANIMAMESLWSREDPARQNAGKDYNFPVVPGTFVASASFAIQVSRATALVNSDTTGGGFAHRLEWALVWRPDRPFPVVRDVSQIAALDWAVPEGTGLTMSAAVEHELARQVWERGQEFRAADDMEGHLPARLAKLLLLVAVARGSRTGEIADLELAQEIVRCSGAIRDWLVSGIAAQKAAEATKKGEEDAQRMAGRNSWTRSVQLIEERILKRLNEHNSVAGWAGSWGGEPVHADSPCLCPASCVNNLFDSKKRADGQHALAALIERALVEVQQVDDRRTQFYALSNDGLKHVMNLGKVPVF
jgi:hypothetical protein